MPGSFQITSFSPVEEAREGQMTSLADGAAINTGDDDYVGIQIQDDDTGKSLQGGVSTVPIPSGAGFSWTSAKDVLMPNKDLNCTCYVGYYVPAQETIYATDQRKFTIRKIAGGIGGIPTWLLAAIGLGAVAAVLLIKK